MSVTFQEQLIDKVFLTGMAQMIGMMLVVDTKSTHQNPDSALTTLWLQGLVACSYSDWSSQKDLSPRCTKVEST